MLFGSAATWGDLRMKGEMMIDFDKLNHPLARTIAFKTSVLTKYETGTKMKYKQRFNAIKNMANGSNLSSRLTANINRNEMIPDITSNDQESTVIWILTLALRRRMILSLSDNPVFRKLSFSVLKWNNFIFYRWSI